jgi:hypothetical protein
MARKDIPAGTNLDAETNELLDKLANLQGASHAEIIRRAIHLLGSTCGLETLSGERERAAAEARVQQRRERLTNPDAPIIKD